MNKIPLYIPSLTAIERENLIKAFDSGWISSRGSFVSEFEENFAKFVNRKHAIAVSNGTVALHAAIEAIKLKYNIQANSNNAILCPSLTYVATANTIRQAGLIPLFVDVNENGVMDIDDVEEGLNCANKNNLNVVGIAPVHLYGNMSSVISDDCMEKFRLPIIEDCAEAFGSKFFGRVCGNSSTDVCCFSFFGNKTITTGEGGMIVCNDDKLYDKLFMLKSVGQKPNIPQRYNHLIVGYNYRMTNLCASIGVSQLSRADEIVNKKRKIADWYKKYLKTDIMLKESHATESSYWMITILLENSIVRDGLALYLDSVGVETRPAFLPMHAMINLKPYVKVDNLKNSERIGSCGLNLPSWPDLQEHQIEFICENINNYINLYSG